jgi:hypothetical protein
VLINQKISIIILYRNNWPWWFEYFLRSCAFNRSIQWLIFSDNNKPENTPDNVWFVNISHDDLLKRIKEKLGVNADIMHPFKFSDFKPAFGLLFSEYINDSNFWGYCDLDLIFGNISKFLVPEIMENYDIISPSIDFFPGHFLILKNQENINNLFKNIHGWKEILCKPDSFCFDENISVPPIPPNSISIQQAMRKRIKKHIMAYRLIRNPFFHYLNQISGQIFEKKRRIKVIKDFNSAIHYGCFQNTLKTFNQQWFMDDIIKLRDGRRSFNVEWNHGKLQDGANELLYFHFPVSKYQNSFKIIETDKSFFRLINDELIL